jgi:hypothetical protein
MGSSSDLLKVLLPGLSPAVSLGLATLVLDPSISISPYFYPILIGGFATFAVSLGSTISLKKPSWKTYFWHILGIGLAAFVVVSWARYQSLVVSILAEFVILISIIIGLLFNRKKIRSRYRKYSALVVFSGLIIIGLFPVASIIQNIGEAPYLVVSPSEKFVYLSKLPIEGNVQFTLIQQDNISITSVYANAWDFRLTTQSSNPYLALYLDDKENGPVEIPFLERGRSLFSNLRIEASQFVENGTYNVTLNFSYTDGLGKSYQGSNEVLVFVETSYTNINTERVAWILLAIFVIVIVILTFVSLKRLHRRLLVG